MKRTLFLVAGEHSGDQRASELIAQLKSLDPNLAFVGLGGKEMAKAGCRILFDLPSVAALGFTDVIKRYGQFRRIFYNALRDIETIKPDAILLIDFPGFNLRLAKKIKKRFPVIFYVSPQIWAWAPYRKHTIARYVHKMLTLFRFEKEAYRGTSLDVEWVGHPLADEFKTLPDRTSIRKSLGLADSKTVVGLHPGSRESEVRRILPIMCEAAALVKKERSDVTFLLSLSPTVDEQAIQAQLSSFPGVDLKIIKGRNRDVLLAGDFAMVCSGTATLEAALSGTPFLIVYKTAYLTYLLARNLMHIPYIGLANVLARRIIVPEFIQHDARPNKLAQCVLSYLSDGERTKKMRVDLEGIKTELGNGGASRQAAEAVLRFITTHQDAKEISLV